MFLLRFLACWRLVCLFVCPWEHYLCVTGSTVGASLGAQYVCPRERLAHNRLAMILWLLDGNLKPSIRAGRGGEVAGWRGVAGAGWRGAVAGRGAVAWQGGVAVAWRGPTTTTGSNNFSSQAHR